MGGHGGLNILPQKSWNVYGQKQRQKVQRDEETAAAAEDAALDTRLQGLRDERLDQLRGRASQRRHEDGTLDLPPSEHVNFFAAEEEALGAHQKAAETTEATRDESSRLAGGFGGAPTPSPWYARKGSSFFHDEAPGDSLPARIRREREEVAALTRGSDRGEHRTTHRQRLSDGDNAAGGGRMIMIGNTDLPSTGSVPPPPSTGTPAHSDHPKEDHQRHSSKKARSGKEKKHRSEKHKSEKHKSEKHKRGVGILAASGGVGKKSIAELRKERMLREHGERRKETMIVGGAS
mmetsp:Transcript_27160/g.67934  ORF Transcript_27160/g.67934 Transcript_27160/m.67934 type:complete len:291 (-) Transcript_27160:316-1188(-)